VRAATPFWIGIRLVMRDGWHVNWVNPGDAGLAPTVAWQLPDGFRAEKIQWPFPARFELPGVCIFGYDHEVVLLSRITPPRDLHPGSACTFKATVSWLACREACVPGDASLTLSLAASASGADEYDGNWKPVVDRSLSLIPAPTAAWRFLAESGNDRIVVEARPSQGLNSPPSTVTFFPVKQGIIENGAPQVWSHSGSVYRLELRRDKLGGALPDTLAGVLVSDQSWEDGRRSVEIEIPLR
jgi:thiol:disulfide interchange protein DsbD